jgi:hypothetical protein
MFACYLGSVWLRNVNGKGNGNPKQQDLMQGSGLLPLFGKHLSGNRISITQGALALW